MKNRVSFLCLPFAIAAFCLTSCGDDAGKQKGYDGRTFDISAAQDGSLLAKSAKVGHNYTLTIEGEGQAVSYDRKELVPWNAIAKKIESVTIKEGISNIGDWYFSALTLDSYFLPASVTKVEEHSFREGTTLYSYASSVEGANGIYYYSETRPTGEGSYFYLDEENNPRIWKPVIEKVSSVLFIGNSFTFYEGSPEDPGVPRYFSAIAGDFGQKTNLDWVLKGSHTLTKFADANDEMGAIVEEKLKTNQYDYVILQEQSTAPINNYSAFEKAVGALKAKVDANQKNCTTVLYETWGSPTGIQGTSFTSVGEMEAALYAAYSKAGKAHSCPVNYVGSAFAYAYETLHMDIYYSDNRHQNNYGAYLSAAVHVHNLYHFNVTQCYEYAGLDAKTCQELLGVANRF